MAIEKSSTKSICKAYWRGLFLSIFETDKILTGVRVFNNGFFTIESKDWHEYWKNVYDLGNGKLKECLNKLYYSWRDYIRLGFNIVQRKHFCYCYFSLLDTLLHHRTKLVAQTWLNALQSVLGFECFWIASSIDREEGIAAGTNTLRNPCYLLAKLKMPKALDNPQFLPMITVADVKRLELFFHYRQYALSSNSPVSLLLYPAVNMESRGKSFILINSMENAISERVDPRSHERAQRLFKHIIFPILCSIKSRGCGITSLEYVDIGAGSSSLTAAICRRIRAMGFQLKLQLWFVDLEPTDPSRFFRNKNIRASLDNLTFLGDDYRDWLSRPRPLPAIHGLCIALVAKLFNNLSSFNIQYLSGEILHPHFDSFEECTHREICHPSDCLAHNGCGEQSLAVSNTRIPLENGRTFAQAALSEYYRGLYLLSGLLDIIESPELGFYLPVRSFNPESLITKDAKSVISRLSENCDYIIVEDADLSPQDLINHATKFSLKNLIIWNMTNVLKLKGNYLYVIWSSKVLNPMLAGERIW